MLINTGKMTGSRKRQNEVQYIHINPVP